MTFVVKWKRIDENEWHDFKKPAIFETLEEARNFIAEEQESSTEFYEFKIFEIGKCPECGETENLGYDEENDLYMCRECGATFIPKL